MSYMPSTIELNPPTDAPPNGTVIVLHGLGADGNDFVPLVDHLGLYNEHHVRFIFPHAPRRAVTVNQGMVMRAWYDIQSLKLSDEEDEAGITAAQAMLNDLIEKEEARGVPSHRIFLAGFSQGGAMALYAGLRYPRPLAGILALSTYLPLADRLSAERTLVNQSIPLFQAHGLFDPVVSLYLGQACHERLVTLGYTVEWHTYDMAHVVIPKEIEHIKAFLHAQIADWRVVAQ
jgi:phospholipase/carboxylesterase